MTGRHPRRRPILLRLRLVLSASAAAAAAGLGTPAAIAQSPADAAGACAKLATLSNFPLAATQITLAKFNARGTTSANGAALPDHCQVQGVINKRVGIDGYPYGDSFEVRLPAPADWNGRFMFQGGGGTEGAVPPAVGIAGTLSPTLAHGWAVASQDGGHQNKDLPHPSQFFLDPQAAVPSLWFDRCHDANRQASHRRLLRPQGKPLLFRRLLHRRPARHGDVAELSRLL